MHWSVRCATSKHESLDGLAVTFLQLIVTRLQQVFTHTRQGNKRLPSFKSIRFEHCWTRWHQHSDARKRPFKNAPQIGLQAKFCVSMSEKGMRPRAGCGRGLATLKKPTTHRMQPPACQCEGHAACMAHEMSMDDAWDEAPWRMV